MCLHVEYWGVRAILLCLILPLWPRSTAFTPGHRLFAAEACWPCGGASCSLGHKKRTAQKRATWLMGAKRPMTQACWRLLWLHLCWWNPASTRPLVLRPAGTVWLCLCFQVLLASKPALQTSYSQHPLVQACSWTFQTAFLNLGP